MPPRFVHVFVSMQAGLDDTGTPRGLPVQSLATTKPGTSKTIDVVTASDAPSNRSSAAKTMSPREAQRRIDVARTLLTRQPDRGEPWHGRFDRVEPPARLALSPRQPSGQGERSICGWPHIASPQYCTP